MRPDGSTSPAGGPVAIEDGTPGFNQLLQLEFVLARSSPVLKRTSSSTFDAALGQLSPLPPPVCAVKPLQLKA